MNKSTLHLLRTAILPGNQLNLNTKGTNFGMAAIPFLTKRVMFSIIKAYQKMDKPGWKMLIFLFFSSIFLHFIVRIEFSPLVEIVL